LEVFMAALRIILTVLLLIDSIVLAVIVLMQEGKAEGLGAIAGIADTYWGKNKGRSMEGKLVQVTTLCMALFFILSVILNIRF